MNENQNPFARNTRKVRALPLLCVVTAGILALSSVIVGRQDNQGSTRVDLSVQDPRPLAKAIESLESRLGWAITYEDPRYAYAGDVSDVTEQVRRDLNKFRPGEAPKVLIPKGGSLTFNYDLASDTVLRSDPELVVQRLLAAHLASGNAGRFGMEKSGRIIHVVPTAVKSSSGKLISQQSILNTVITLPAKERTGVQTLEDVCSAVSKVIHMPVVVGTIPASLFFRHKDSEKVSGQRARDALSLLLGRVSNGTILSWQLFYDPGVKMYVLNIHLV